MGLAQSKRSVNITTDPAKEAVVTEGTGKLEKIGEVDQLKAQANGDAQHNDGENETKVETDAAENEKDSTTEKANKEGGDGGGGGVGDTTGNAITPTAEKEDTESDANNKTLENGSNDESLNDSKAPADEAGKKPKKPKKKWSFRSLSFSKKDKQKPAKKEKDEERVNGECEKVPEEPTEDVTAATAAVAQEAASTTTAEAGTSETKPENVAAAAAVAVVAAPEVSTTSTSEAVVVAAPAVSDVTTTNSAAVDSTKVEEPAIEAVAVAAEQSAPAVPAVVEDTKVEEVAKDIAVVENGQPKEAEVPTVVPVLTQEEKSEPEIIAATPAPVAADVLVEEKVVEQKDEQAVVEVMVFVEASLSQVATDPSSMEENPSLVSVPQSTTEVLETAVVAPVEKSIEVEAQSAELHSSDAAVGDVSPLKSEEAKENAPVVAVVTSLEEKPLPSTPSVVEETIVVENVANVEASAKPEESLVSEEIKETATKAVGEILEAAVDKIEAGDVQLSPVPIVEEQQKDQVEPTDATVAQPLPEVEAVDEISNNIDDLPPPPPPPAVDDDETVPDSLPSPLPTIAAAVPADLELPVDELKQQDTSVLSVDISSPLQQNSLESLPSPPTLSQSEVSLPPPPESPTAIALPSAMPTGMAESEIDSVAALPSPPPAPSSACDDPLDTSIPSSLPAAEVEVVKHEETVASSATIQQKVDDATALPATLVEAPATVENKLNESVTVTDASEAKKVEENVKIDDDVQQDSLVPTKATAAASVTEETAVGEEKVAEAQVVPPVVADVPAEVEETVAQKQNGTEDHGASNGTIENGKTENGKLENGQNGVHETSATESLNGETEHKKEDKIAEKAAQLQQPPPAAPEVTAE
uniref:Uncharacterized protein n=1 Tax=Anopheles farauti TaxID=69004 RepID=A0A182QD16_9DIPT